MCRKNQTSCWMIVFCVMFLFGARQLPAQTIWDGGGADDNWFTALNWDTNVVPNGITANVVVGVPSPTNVNGNININSLMVGASGIINVNASQNVDFGGVALTTLINMGTINTANNSDLQLSQIVSNSGNINVIAGANATDLEIPAIGAMLDGGGVISLSGANARINGISALLTIIDQTIEGQGNIGTNSTEIDNQGNLIDANSDGNILSIDPNANGMTNSGTMQASGGGILSLIAAEYDNTGGTIQALAGSEVRLNTSSSITGGILSTSGDGILRVPVSQDVFMTDLSIEGTLVAENNSDTGISGTIANTGTIMINSGINATDIEIQTGGATLTGGGTVTLGGSVNSRIEGVTGAGFLTIEDQLIEGLGNIGTNTIGIDNQGNLIDANSDGNILSIDPNANGMMNSGTMQASGGGILTLNAADYDNTGGIIQALAGSEVRLNTSSSITGGILSTSGDGILRVPVSQDVFMTDLSIAGTLVAENNSDTGLSGTITNTGTIMINSGINATDIEIQTGGATLTGGGTVTFGGSVNSRIEGVPGAGFLTIEDQTIEGLGNIGTNTIGIDNQGNLIDANSDGNILFIDPNASGMMNSGTMQASGGGILFLIAAAYDNTGGTIQALAGSEVRLNDSSSITGGILSTSGDGVLRVPISQNAFLTDLSIAGTLVAENNSDTGLSGTITNSGTILINSGANATDIEIQTGGATLAGDGTVSLSGINARFDGVGDLEMTGGTLMGIGQVVVNSLFSDDAVVAPGNSIGELNFEGNHNNRFEDGTTIEIEMNLASGVPSINWDFLDVNGTLNFSGNVLPADVIIKLVTLDGNGDPGPLSDFNQNDDYSFRIAAATDITGFRPGDFTIDVSEFANSFNGRFSITIGPNGGEEALFIKYGQFSLGDVNHDGVVSLLDVAPFVNAVGAGQFIAEADINCDGQVNLLDVSPFVLVLTN